MRINNQKQNFKSLSPLTKPLGQFYNANATIPTLIIESGVTLGRAYEANKRGGKPEAVDRLVEQGVSAVVWIYGVKILKNIGDFIGKKLLDIKNLDFDIGFDELRNPMKELLKTAEDRKALGFKAGNILVCTALATYFIGAILPKINNAILKKTLKKEEAKKETYKPKSVSFEEFKNKTSKKEPVSFTGVLDGAINVAHVLENNSAARLFITDTGVIAGRFHNAPNKYRKIEGLFRDIASIYFYLAATKDIVEILNGKKNTDIDPKVVEKTVDMLCEKLKNEPIKSAEDFLEKAVKEPSNDVLEQLKKAFDGKKVITVNDFSKIFGLKDEALKMSAMQHPFDGDELLSFQQAKDVLSPCWVNEPEFLKKSYELATGKKNIADSKCFVASKELDKIRNSIDKFVEQIARYANDEGLEINDALIKKVAKKNISKNFWFNVVGTALSTFALGILIPKIQYAITKKMTNENKFHVEEG